MWRGVKLQKESGPVVRYNCRALVLRLRLQEFRVRLILPLLPGIRFNLA
jgi:hypothetical protein